MRVGFENVVDQINVIQIQTHVIQAYLYNTLASGVSVHYMICRIICGTTYGAICIALSMIDCSAPLIQIILILSIDAEGC